MTLAFKQIGTSWSLAFLATVIVAGCQRAEPPSTVNRDVTTAEQKADSRIQHARADAERDVANAQEKVDAKAIDRNNVAAKDSYKVAMVKADGAHDVALQQCKALSGDAQKHCKDQADADYDAAKANAKSLEVSRTQ